MLSRSNTNTTHPLQNLNGDQLFHLHALKASYQVDKVPSTYNEAMRSPHHGMWKEAMDRELASLKLHETYTLVDPPSNVKIIGGRWVFSIKSKPDGQTLAKARWVAKGFMQNYGENYKDTFAPMSRMTSLRCMMQLVAQEGYIAHQLDVTTAYLNAKVDHDIYMEQPHGAVEGGDSKVCLLHKSLYGLKQSAKLWNDTIHSYLVSLKFTRNSADMCLYQRSDGRGTIYLIIWVDDVVMISNKQAVIDEFKQEISNHFLVKDLGTLKYFLGIQFEITPGRVIMTQDNHSYQVLDRFNMNDASPIKIPMVINIHDEIKAHSEDQVLDKKMTTRYQELVGSLIYLEQIQCTRPDLSNPTNLLGQSMSKPNQFYWEVARMVLKYLLGTTHYSLIYCKCDKLKLIAHM